MVNDLICNLLMSYAATKRSAIRRQTVSGSEGDVSARNRIFVENALANAFHVSHCVGLQVYGFTGLDL